MIQRPPLQPGDYFPERFRDDLRGSLLQGADHDQVFTDEDRANFQEYGRLLVCAMGGPTVTRRSRVGFTHIFRIAKRKRIFLRKARSFARAVWSFIRRGDVGIREYDRRMNNCLNCVELVETSTGRFCGACECPQSLVSDVRTKCRMPGAGCPKGKW